jgi:uncharacterized protein YacL
MNLSMQPRVPQTGFSLSSLAVPFIIVFSVLLVIVFIFFSYAIKKKDEIERVAKANR